MNDELPHDATRVLQRMHTLDDPAAAELLPLVYDALHDLAAAYMRRERPAHTLQPTALVHEAYVKLIGQTKLEFKDRSHFLAVAARAMRQVLVDSARARKAAKRGGDHARITLDAALDARGTDALELLAVHEALEKLAAHDTRLSRIVELRFFGGLTIKETTWVLGVSHATVEEDWALAKAWLGRELSDGRPK